MFNKDKNSNKKSKNEKDNIEQFKVNEASLKILQKSGKFDLTSNEFEKRL